jgi:hypothetical protein
MQRIGLIGAALGTLCACTGQVPTRTACVVAPVSGFVGAGGGQTRITVAQNGDPCVIAASIRGGAMGQGTIETPPAHGDATVQVTADATRISYTPARDYVGDDAFKVALGPNFIISVSVSVVPVAAAPR